jgi:hypothetical protein
VIHGYDIIIRKGEDTSQIYFRHVHDHKNVLEISHKWKAERGNANLQVELVLYLDHDGHTGNKKVGFRVQ